MYQSIKDGRLMDFRVSLQPSRIRWLYVFYFEFIRNQITNYFLEKLETENSFDNFVNSRIRSKTFGTLERRIPQTITERNYKWSFRKGRNFSLTVLFLLFLFSFLQFVVQKLYGESDVWKRRWKGRVEVCWRWFDVCMFSLLREGRSWSGQSEEGRQRIRTWIEREKFEESFWIAGRIVWVSLSPVCLVIGPSCYPNFLSPLSLSLTYKVYFSFSRWLSNLHTHISHSFAPYFA